MVNQQPKLNRKKNWQMKLIWKLKRKQPGRLYNSLRQIGHKKKPEKIKSNDSPSSKVVKGIKKSVGSSKSEDSISSKDSNESKVSNLSNNNANPNSR